MIFRHVIVIHQEKGPLDVYPEVLSEDQFDALVDYSYVEPIVILVDWSEKKGDNEDEA